jgi:hypothetical protein
MNQLWRITLHRIIPVSVLASFLSVQFGHSQTLTVHRAVCVQWTADTDSRCSVEKSTNLLSGTWTPVGFEVQGYGQDLQWFERMTDPTAFYRLVAVSLPGTEFRLGEYREHSVNGGDRSWSSECTDTEILNGYLAYHVIERIDGVIQSHKWRTVSNNQLLWLKTVEAAQTNVYSPPRVLVDYPLYIGKSWSMLPGVVATVATQETVQTSWGICSNSYKVGYRVGAQPPEYRWISPQYGDVKRQTTTEVSLLKTLTTISTGVWYGAGTQFGMASPTLAYVHLNITNQNQDAIMGVLTMHTPAADLSCSGIGTVRNWVVDMDFGEWRLRGSFGWDYILDGEITNEDTKTRFRATRQGILQTRQPDEPLP